MFLWSFKLSVIVLQHRNEIFLIMLIHMEVTLNKIRVEQYVFKVTLILTPIYFYITDILSDELMKKKILLCLSALDDWTLHTLWRLFFFKKVGYYKIKNLLRVILKSCRKKWDTESWGTLIMFLCSYLNRMSLNICKSN